MTGIGFGPLLFVIYISDLDMNMRVMINNLWMVQRTVLSVRRIILGYRTIWFSYLSKTVAN